jgi:signal transduction histidine kinase/CheY-like chemotaxis protein
MDPPDKPDFSPASAPEPAAAAQDFPAGTPTALSAETMSLASLVHHNIAVDQDLPLEELQKVFRDQQVDFVAMVSGDVVKGLCSRVRLGSLLGSRYGFALYAKSPAHLVQVAHPLVFSSTTSVRSVLDRSLERHANEFHEDVVLVDGEYRLLGLIPVESIAYLQTRLVREQLGELQRQHERMQRQNMELFQTNHALRQAEALNRGLFESNTLGVALMDASGTINTHNRRLAELLNLGEGPVEIPSLSGWMEEGDRLHFSCMLAGLARGIADMDPGSREFTLHVPGRGARLFRFTTGWIRETGQICACLDDITEQRVLERNLARQEKQRLLDTLVGGIAHELNNKLTPVLGFAELLELKAEPETKQHAALIGKSTQEACRIIRQLLQLSKPVASNPQRIDLGVVVEESLMMLKFQVREQRCEVQYARPHSPVVVVADPSQMKQVVINLVLNALQAMEGAAKPRLALSVGGGPAGAFLTVSDNGTGISAENMSRIFEPFFTTKGPDRGSGLGLSMCFSIARQYGGDISAESRPGAGAKFTVTLPLDHGAVEPVAAGRAPAPQNRQEAHRARVLVVDDEAVVRKLLQEMLRSEFGCDVDLAPNGAEALELAGQTEYHLVISDIRMPVMAGTEFYLRLRERQPKLAQRFAFITGHPGEKDLRNEIARWDVPVIAKPFTISRLTEVCVPYLSLAAPEAESA